MDQDTFNRLYLLSQYIIAVGSLILAALAIFGDPIRAFILRPKLQMHVNNKQGELVRWTNGVIAIYYHLKIENHGHSTAKNVRVLCHRISKKRADGSFVPESMAAPERLMWRFSNVFGLMRDIPNGYVGKLGEICDLGVLNQGAAKFLITPYSQTDSFPGYLMANQSMRISLAVAADNFTPDKSYELEISWDGNWTSNLSEMEKHLIIKEVIN